MASTSTNNLTLLDFTQRLTAKGSIESKLVELMSQSNEILDDCVYQESNGPTTHRVVLRTTLPTVQWRAVNTGVAPSKSSTMTVDEGIGMLEAYSNTDAALVRLNGQPAEFRLSEDRAFIEAMSQEMARVLFYGQKSSNPNPLEFLGIAPRYDGSSTVNADNIINCNPSTSSSALTSIYLVVWGDDTVFGIFPKGSKSGLEVIDNGRLTVYDSNMYPFDAYQSHYIWKMGLVVKDWRYVVRIANIDVDGIAGLTGSFGPSDITEQSIIHAMATALMKIPHLGAGRPVFYMPRCVYAGLTRMSMEKDCRIFSTQQGLNQYGAPRTWTTFQGIPLRKVDQISLSEAKV